jgi:hypothetical protein
MIIVADRSGRLGNRLLLLIHLLAVAHHLQRLCLLGFLGPYSRCFPELETFAIPKGGERPRRHLPPIIVRPLREASFWTAWLIAGVLNRVRLRKSPIHTFIRLSFQEQLSLDDSQVRIMIERPIVILQGWRFRAPELLSAHSQSIRDLLRAADDVQTRAQGLIERARHQSAHELIGVHIRRADYAHHFDGRYFFDPRDYFESIVAMRDPLKERAHFLLMGDDPESLREVARLLRIAGVGEQVTVSEESKEVDLMALADCDRIVGPPSSFSMFASWYGETPLHILTQPGREIHLEDFAVYPDLLDGEVANLY